MAEKKKKSVWGRIFAFLPLLIIPQILNWAQFQKDLAMYGYADNGDVSTHLWHLSTQTEFLLYVALACFVLEIAKAVALSTDYIDLMLSGALTAAVWWISQNWDHQITETFVFRFCFWLMVADVALGPLIIKNTTRTTLEGGGR